MNAFPDDGFTVTTKAPLLALLLIFAALEKGAEVAQICRFHRAAPE